jgi:hypothetical protein
MPDSNMRQQADARILNLVDQVRVRPGRPGLPPAKINGMVEEKVNAVRGARRNRYNEPSRSEPSATAGVLR